MISEPVQDGQDTAAAAPPADAGDPAAHAAADADDGAAAPAAAPSAEEVVAHRSGDVLLRHTILKSDHFPGCQNMRLTPLLEGAPNFRQVPGLPVYGAAIPTASGLRLVLDRLGAAKGRRRVLWHNMREEPVLYVNGRPFVVREADKPFANLEYTGIDRARVEGMEARLKADVLAEAARYGGAVLVAHEDDHFQVVEEWEPVTEADVQTPAEVYAELALDGYEVDYLRVPVTDEKAPKGDDFEALIARCWAPPEGAALVFNCQMGRGRTTTGMVIGCLLALRRARPTLGPPPPRPAPGAPDWFVAAPAAAADPRSPRGGAPAATAASVAASEEEEFRAGRFAAVRSLLRALRRGREAKAALDSVLDACSVMQNLREAIASYRGRLVHEANDMRRQALLQVCLEYLERYFVLVAFAAYLDDPGFAPGSNDASPHVPFEEWWGARPELQGILRRLLRTNPLAALALEGGGGGGGAAAAAAPAGGALSPRGAGPAAPAPSATEDEEEEDELGDVVARRGGSVLGPHTILKQDHFPGCQSSRLPAAIPGAPNFRGVPGDEVRVYGGAIATVEGVRRVLDHLGAGPDAGGAAGAGGAAAAPLASPFEDAVAGSAAVRAGRAVWHMMREEPVVFIQGQPYVLREDSRPFKNLLEYRGIDAERLDQMEQRLRDDVLAEAAQFGGRLLVTREGGDPGGGPAGAALLGRRLRAEFLPIGDHPAAVQTPRQVFEALQGEGYRVTFVRVPLTDGTCPRPADFDLFYSAAAAAGPGDALIYTCQLGGGRTTTGMAIGTLLRVYVNGAPAPAPSELERRQTLERMDEDVGGGSPRGGSDDEEEEGEGACREDGGDPFGGGAAALTVAAAAAAAAAAAPSPRETPYDAESRNLLDGEYVGMRRFTRILERGPQAKAAVDGVVDACGLLLNLRTSIMRYRRPKSARRFFRPEIQARHSAFQRGSAYLERYCMLVAFAVYLQQCRDHGRRRSFEDWLAARPDVVQAREALHQNPAGALAPVPAAFPPTPAARGGAAPLPPLPPASASRAASRDVPVEEQRRVLLKRHGSTVGRRSILKSYTIAGRLPPGAPPPPLPPGVSDLRQASHGLAVYALGNASVSGLRLLLAALGAGAGGPAHVMVTDLREELALYVNGTAYLRRELEMPAAALHHAGIQAGKLEDLEVRLRGDVEAEAAAWGGCVLLHREREVPAPPRFAPPPPRVAPPPAGDGDDGAFLRRKPDSPAGAAAAGVGAGGAPGSTGTAAPGGTSTSSITEEEEDITRSTGNFQPTTRVSAFWEEVGGPPYAIDAGLCTPAEVFAGLQAEGLQVTYRRVPMSRERTPQAADLDQLHAQLRARAPAGRRLVHLLVSRTATGSSARFAAAFACTCLRAANGSDAAAALAARSAAAAAAGAGGGGSMPGASPRTGGGGGSPSLARVSPAAKRPRGAGAGALLRADSEVSELARSSEGGEYRGVMNLCRVLPGGAELKGAVDEAVDACGAIGNLREDIFRCKRAAEDEGGADGEPQAAAAARLLGLHYLQRYFFLVAFRAYLLEAERGAPGAPGAQAQQPQGTPFSEWVAERRELTYLLSTLELD